MSRSFRILSLQPFYGGSHRQMMEGWIAGSRHDWTVLSLPARFWKWRMRHAAIEFSRQANELIRKGERFDAVFCTDMLNLAEFCGLAEEAIFRLPTIIYFHENQFTYPVRPGKEIDLNAAFTNLISMIAADQIWFNSEFNRSSMRDEATLRLSTWPDFAPRLEVDEAFNRSSVQPPGINVPDIQSSAPAKRPGNTIHLIWAARWEYDKDPDLLLEILRCLKAESIDFKISVIGQTYSTIPDAMHKIENEFASQIAHWGFQESREDYWQVLREADVFFSTAIHEFFGLSAAEAIAANCIPLLPHRLAYPELLDVENHSHRKQFFYDGTASDFVAKLTNIRTIHLRKADSDVADLTHAISNRFGWKTRSGQLDEAIGAAIDASIEERGETADQ